jgi:AcrR family transcriptional regulator
VFARQGFHTCRVSDIADEAGVAYGLVYHYFDSKGEILDTLFSERWQVLLDVIAEIERGDAPVREQLETIVAFIVDSYVHDPELMKVIIVEVTRAANTFGRTHQFAALAFYGAIEQSLTGWIFDVLPTGAGDYEEAKRYIVETICSGLEPPVAERPSTSAL